MSAIKSTSEKTTKAIAWAYPSSRNAIKLGFAKTGCYDVTTDGPNMETLLKGFTTWDAAKAYAGTLKEPFSKWSMKKPTHCA